MCVGEIFSIGLFFCPVIQKSQGKEQFPFI